MKTLDDLLAENARLTQQVANLTAELSAEKAKTAAPKTDPGKVTTPKSADWKADARARFAKTSN